MLQEEIIKHNKNNSIYFQLLLDFGHVFYFKDLLFIQEIHFWGSKDLTNSQRINTMITDTFLSPMTPKGVQA